MHDILDLDRYPLHEPASDAHVALVERCIAELDAEGLFDLPALVRPEALETAMHALGPRFDTEAFHHAREHNIYFRKEVDGLPAAHPALRRFRTSNRTLCTDQLGATFLRALHAWPPFVEFLAETMGQSRLHPMEDPLAAVNVMAYGDGEALNWHFDRSEFTTTLLLQAPRKGGAFEYAKDLRTPRDPNYDGVARLFDGAVPTVTTSPEPGTLNVFRGKNTAHRVTPVAGPDARVIAVFSYYDRPGVMFSQDERVGFYGRAE